ncbi:MAG: hypothetical protein M3Z75_28495 [Actinomycetota bacterium]|nr:hypothetical protein [Actinomycetota bacterium]
MRDAFTGEATDSVIRWSEGRLETVDSVSAIEDPGAFLITARAREMHAVRLYRMHLTAEGHIAGLDDVTYPVNQAEEMAFLARTVASQHGGKVVYTVVERLGHSPSNPPQPGARLTPRTTLVCTVLGTGQVTRHTSQIPGVIDTLTWDARGRVLAYTLRAADGNTLRTVDTTTAEDWVIDSRVIAAGASIYGNYIWSVISPSGQSIYAIAARSGPQGSMLIELPVIRGRSPRILARERTHTWNRLCINRAGHYLLLFSSDRIHRVSLPAGEVTEVSAMTRPVAWAAW